MESFLEKALTAIANGGGAGAVIALSLVWYLARRDARRVENPPAATDSDGATGAPFQRASSVTKDNCSQVHEAVIEMARLHGRQTEILEQQTEMIQRCADRHEETRITLARMETKLEHQRSNGRG